MSQEYPEPCLNIKTVFFRYMDFHYKDKTVMRLSYLYNGNPQTRTMTSLYWTSLAADTWEHPPQKVWNTSCNELMFDKKFAKCPKIAFITTKLYWYNIFHFKIQYSPSKENMICPLKKNSVSKIEKQLQYKTNRIPFCTNQLKYKHIPSTYTSTQNLT